MKHLYPSIRFEVVRMREIPLPPIAPTARQTQVVDFRDTALRPKDDMVYRHWDSSLFGGTQAIRTAILGSNRHESS